MVEYCPVCTNPLPSVDSNYCENCGFDRSCNYEMFPTLVPIPEGEPSLFAKRVQREQLHSTEEPEPRQKKSWLRRIVEFLVGMVNVLIAIFISLIVFAYGSKLLNYYPPETLAAIIIYMPLFLGFIFLGIRLTVIEFRFIDKIVSK